MKMKLKIYFGILIAMVAEMIYAVCVARGADIGFWYGVLALIFSFSMLMFNWGLGDLEKMIVDTKKDTR